MTLPKSSFLSELPAPPSLLRHFPGRAWLWLAVWFGAMTAVPIAIWTAGPASTPTTMLVATLAQALLVFSLLVHAWGWSRALLTFIGVGLLGWGVEYLGTATGFPFGSYDYTSRLQPQINHVPILVPLAWFMMLPASWAISERITGRNRGWRFILVAATAMTAWDLFLDPQMVTWDFWVWRNVPPVSYFGIPWQNYGGWLLASAVMTAVLRPPSLRSSIPALLIIYGLTWFFQAGGLLFFWGLPGPAVVGAVTMGAFLFFARRSPNRR